MKKEAAKKRLEKLKKEIEYHRYQYHVLDIESINPSALDSLKKELFDLENKYPDLISPDSPSQRVAGKALEKFKKINHQRPMTSLNDAFSFEDLKDWEKRNLKILNKNEIKVNNFDYWCELKLDGLAVNLLYNKTNFEHGATRGDGAVGEDISNNLKTINTLPLKLKIPNKSELIKLNFSKSDIEKIYYILNNKKLEVRGEAIMLKSVLERINQKNKQENKALLANTRNAAAGSLRQLNPKIAKERNLSFFAFDLYFNDLELNELIKKRQQTYKLLSLLGFKVLETVKLVSSLKEALSWQNEIKEKRQSFDFEIDGIVIKINDHKYWLDLGIVGKAPRYMIAFKFPAEQSTTKLLNVDWQVGRSGALTPRAIFEPVKVGGAKVSRASLHNFDEINRLNLKIGDTVVIERAGDVIPKVISVLTGLRDGSEKKIKPPKYCPRCSEEVKRQESMSTYRCFNKKCQEVALRRLIHFVSKPAFNIEGLGEKIIILLFQEGLIKKADDIFRLKASDLLKLEGFKEKKVRNILEAIEEKKNIELSRFLKALSISQIGEVSAIKIEEIIALETNKKTMKPSELFFWAKEKTFDYWYKIEDVGEVVAKSLVDYWQNKSTQDLLTNLEKEGILLLIKKRKNNLKFSQKTFVLTGKLASLTRDEAKDKIKQVGGIVKDQIVKDLDYLIVGDDPGSKLEKAKKLNIEILNEEDFLKKII